MVIPNEEGGQPSQVDPGNMEVYVFERFFEAPGFPSLPFRFGVDALSVMQLMVQAQASGLDADDPTRVYMLRAWVRIW